MTLDGEDLQRDQCENPYLDIEGRPQEPRKLERLSNGIVSIFVDPSNDEIALVRVQKVPRLIRFFGKVYQKEVCKERRRAGELSISVMHREPMGTGEDSRHPP